MTDPMPQIKTQGSGLDGSIAFRSVVLLYLGLTLAACGGNTPLKSPEATEGVPPAATMLPTETAGVATDTPTAPILTPTATRTSIPTRTPFPTPSRYFETSGPVHFSFIPPYEWLMREWKSSPYTAWHWSRSKGRTFDIGFFWEQYSGSAKSFAMEVVQSIDSGSNNDPRTEYKMISEGVFITDAGVESYKIIYKSNDYTANFFLYHIYYYFYREGNIIKALFLRDELWGSARDP
ncbi:MAG: hypothetical protein WBM17_11300, partial [Anaerolineales bacterium]